MSSNFVLNVLFEDHSAESYVTGCTYMSLQNLSSILLDYKFPLLINGSTILCTVSRFQTKNCGDWFHKVCLKFYFSHSHKI